MIIETKKFFKGGNEVREITQIISHKLEDVGVFGYTFNEVNLKKGEILFERDFQNKINLIRKCEKEVFGEQEGKVKLVPYRSDNEWYIQK